MPTADSPLIGASRLEAFNNYFDLSLAMTRKQRDEVYQIRYRVYCEEFGYEPASVFSNHQEVDEFDCQSIHCLVTHRASGQPAGCVRVVMVEDNDRMPMEAHVGDSLDQSFFDSFRDRRNTLCEISRLAVDTGFRRRHRDQETRFGNIDSNSFSTGELRTFPLIALALMLGAGAAADILERKNCFAIMESALPKLMKRTGIDFRRVGTDFEFHGVRAPYYANMDELIKNATPELRLYFNEIRKQFAATLLDVPLVPRMVDSRNNRTWHPFAFPAGPQILDNSGCFITPPGWLEFLGEGTA